MKGKVIILYCLLLIIGSMPILNMTGCCHEYHGPIETTLNEVSNVLGIEIPTPTYLPEGIKIQKVYFEENIVTLIANSGDIDSNQQSTIRINITWNIDQIPKPMKLSSSRVVIDSNITGLMIYSCDLKELRWSWFPNQGDNSWYSFVIIAENSIADEEIIKIARGMGRL